MPTGVRWKGLIIEDTSYCNFRIQRNLGGIELEVHSLLSVSVQETEWWRRRSQQKSFLALDIVCYNTSLPYLHVIKRFLLLEQGHVCHRGNQMISDCV